MEGEEEEGSLSSGNSNFCIKSHIVVILRRVWWQTQRTESVRGDNWLLLNGCVMTENEITASQNPFKHSKAPWVPNIGIGFKPSYTCRHRKSWVKRALFHLHSTRSKQRLPYIIIQGPVNRVFYAVVPTSTSSPLACYHLPLMASFPSCFSSKVFQIKRGKAFLFFISSQVSLFQARKKTNQPWT